MLRQKKKFSEQLTKFYIAQLLLGLGKLQAHAFIHRDLKLENLMLDADGYLKMIDFDTVCKLNGETVTNEDCGTEEYKAPEMFC